MIVDESKYMYIFYEFSKLIWHSLCWKKLTLGEDTNFSLLIIISTNTTLKIELSIMMPTLSSLLGSRLPWYQLCRHINAPDQILVLHHNMMTSSNGNIFRVTDPLCGEFTGPGEFPTQRPVTRSFDVFFDPRLNKRLSKQPWGWWFETPPWSLWRHCNNANFIVRHRRHRRLSFWLLTISWSVTTKLAS